MTPSVLQKLQAAAGVRPTPSAPASKAQRPAPAAPRVGKIALA